MQGIAVQCSAVVRFRTFDEANVKGERKQKYTYTKGTTSVITESVRKIQVRCLRGILKPSFSAIMTDLALDLNLL